MFKDIIYVLLLTTTFLYSNYSFASCTKYLNEKSVICSTEYHTVKNSQELLNYLRFGKFEKGMLLNLKIDFDLKASNISIDLPCSFTIANKRKIQTDQGDICISADNLVFEGFNNIETKNFGNIELSAQRNLGLRPSGWMI